MRRIKSAPANLCEMSHTTLTKRMSVVPEPRSDDIADQFAQTISDKLNMNDSMEQALFSVVMQYVFRSSSKPSPAFTFKDMLFRMMVIFITHNATSLLTDTLVSKVHVLIQ